MVDVKNGNVHQKTQHVRLKNYDGVKGQGKETAMWCRVNRGHYCYIPSLTFISRTLKIQFSLLTLLFFVLANVDPDQVTDNYHHLVQRYLLPFFFKKKNRFGTATAYCLPCWRAFCVATMKLMRSSTHWCLSRHKATKWWWSLSLTKVALPTASTWLGLPVSWWVAQTCMLSVIYWARKQRTFSMCMTCVTHWPDRDDTAIRDLWLCPGNKDRMD